MFSSYQSSSAPQSGTSPASALATWSADLDDVAFGCECADPSLQIAFWSQEVTLAAPSAGAVD